MGNGAFSNECPRQTSTVPKLLNTHSDGVVDSIHAVRKSVLSIHVLAG